MIMFWYLDTCIQWPSNMRGEILETEDLKAITGHTRPGDIARWLTRQGVKYFRGKSGTIFTTQRLLEAAVGFVPNTPAANDHYKPDDLV